MESLKISVIKTIGQLSYYFDECIAVEYSMDLFVNDEKECTFLCSPSDLEDLVVGHLIGKGMINSKDDFKLKIDIEQSICEATVKCLNPNHMILPKYIKVKTQTIYTIMAKNLEHSETFRKTGSVHSVAIFDDENTVVIMEDVARHNALDKAIGYCFLNDIPLNDKILVVSGRISTEMATKAKNAGVPVILSKSAPTSLSVQTAHDAGITLVGFVRSEKMNVYTHPNRIDLSEHIFSEMVKKNG